MVLFHFLNGDSDASPGSHQHAKLSGLGNYRALMDIFYNRTEDLYSTARPPWEVPELREVLHESWHASRPNFRSKCNETVPMRYWANAGWCRILFFVQGVLLLNTPYNIQMIIRTMGNLIIWMSYRAFNYGAPCTFLSFTYKMKGVPCDADAVMNFAKTASDAVMKSCRCGIEVNWRCFRNHSGAHCCQNVCRPDEMGWIYFFLINFIFVTLVSPHLALRKIESFFRWRTRAFRFPRGEIPLVFLKKK